MPNVSFNEEQSVMRTQPVTRDPLLVRLLYKTGMVHTRRGAEMILFGIAVVALLLAVLFFPKGRGAPELDVPMAVPESTGVR